MNREVYPLPFGGLYRYDVGSTALVQIVSLHVGGYHGRQCMGGWRFLTHHQLQPASAEDHRTWADNARWRRETPLDPGFTDTPPGYQHDAFTGAAIESKVGEPEGPNVKQAWWAGYVAGRGLPAGTPRQVAVAHAAPFTNAPAGTEQRARAILVERLEAMQKTGDAWLTIAAFLALMADSDRRAVLEMKA